MTHIFPMPQDRVEAMIKKGVKCKVIGINKDITNMVDAEFEIDTNSDLQTVILSDDSYIVDLTMKKMRA